MLGFYALGLTVLLILGWWVIGMSKGSQRRGAPLSNIAQHEYAVVPIEPTAPILRTRNVGPCTAWYGWDSKRRVAFLAHFDTPCSARSVPNIIRELRKHTPPGTHFVTRLEGGLFLTFLYSLLTRSAIKKAAHGQKDVTFEFYRWESFNRWVSRDISLRPFTGEVSYAKLAGAKHRKGLLWLFQPMVKVVPPINEDELKR